MIREPISDDFKYCYQAWLYDNRIWWQPNNIDNQTTLIIIIIIDHRSVVQSGIRIENDFFSRTVEQGSVISLE